MIQTQSVAAVEEEVDEEDGVETYNGFKKKVPRGVTDTFRNEYNLSCTR
jgi:hypothetical protein